MKIRAFQRMSLISLTLLGACASGEPEEGSGDPSASGAASEVSEADVASAKQTARESLTRDAKHLVSYLDEPSVADKGKGSPAGDDSVELTQQALFGINLCYVHRANPLWWSGVSAIRYFRGTGHIDRSNCKQKATNPAWHVELSLVNPAAASQLAPFGVPGGGGDCACAYVF